MKRLNRWIVLCMIITVFTSLLSACSGKGSEPNTAQNEENGNTPVKIKWFVAADWYKKQWDAENVLVDKMVTDATGVTVEFISGNEEKLSAMIASGDIPDVVTVWNIAPQRKILENSGLVVPLDELIEKYTPDFKVAQSIQDWYRNEDGHFYGLPNYFYAEETMQEEDTLATHIDIVARRDIMEQVGIKPEDFNTKQGTLDALRKVKESGIKYNGFSMIPAYFDHHNLVHFFGAAPEAKDGSWQDMLRTPESLEAYKFLNQLYREGLLPQDSITLNDDQKMEKIAAGSVFAKTRALLRWEALYQNDNNAVYVPVGPIKGDAGNDLYATPSPLSGWMLSMIGTESKYQEEIIRLFEYLSTDEMSLNVFYGPKDVAWTYDDNGKVKFTEQRIKDFADDPAAAQRKYGNDTFGWLINWVPIKRTWPEASNEFEKVMQEHDKYFEQFAYNDLAFEATTVQGGTTEAGVEAKIKDYRAKMEAKMILAKSEEEVEKIFNEMPAQEEQLGYQQLYDYKNKAFQDAKASLGQKFAYPPNQ
ncbi:extracellular solute-binding protein [Paenibacillus lemnae]|uniref:Extracellular solute-binding protein n=1 Tax=Paenibacillus lemnae TaxID=1330551 RepID=A0A848MD42_PAELE|nr:extracellular solute-binding protein [Paenibacillus lemnae]NMO98060.1 extracellular solute-binding protein [Paenibacillus lemnae]